MKNISRKQASQSIEKETEWKTERMIEWFGSVTYGNLEKAITDIKRLILDSKDEEIVLSISSPGGATGIGMNFFDTIRSVLKPNLVTIGSGDVDSSGIIVFLSGKKRYLTKNTTLLLHLAGRTFEGGKRFTTAELNAMVNEDKLKDFQYACVVSDHTNGKHCPDEILKMMANNTILTAEEAVAMGLAHKVL